MKLEQDVYIPKTLDECYPELDNIFSSIEYSDNKTIIDDLKSNKLGTADFHFGVGTWIRNKWGLWSGSELSRYFNDVGIHHPDDMYAIIMDSYIAKLRNEEYDLEADVSHYQEYWKNIKDNYEG